MFSVGNGKYYAKQGWDSGAVTKKADCSALKKLSPFDQVAKAGSTAVAVPVAPGETIRDVVHGAFARAPWPSQLGLVLAVLPNSLGLPEAALAGDDAALSVVGHGDELWILNAECFFDGDTSSRLSADEVSVPPRSRLDSSSRTVATASASRSSVATSLDASRSSAYRRRKNASCQSYASCST